MRRPVPLSCVVGLLALVLYLLTLYPDLPGGDAGELIAASVTGGAPHPPGYPLYALLVRAFAHLPHGTLAWRCNLLSAICDAAAAGLLCLAVARWTRLVWAGVLAGSLFAFAPGVWLYAISAEVFALNNLVCAAILACATGRGARFARLGALIFGLGLANHQTVIFTGLPILLAMMWRTRDFTRPGLCVLLGLIPYATLLWAHGGISWGDTTTLAGLIHHVLRRDYGTFQLASAGVAVDGSLLETARAFAGDLLGALGWRAVPLALWGVVVVYRTRRFVLFVPPIAAVLVITLLGHLPAQLPLYRGILARFWEQPEIYVFAYCGFALTARSIRRFAPLLAVGLGSLQAGLHFAALDHHADRVVRSYGAELLRIMPPNALAISHGDLVTNTMRYLQVAEGMRPDVLVVDEEIYSFAWGRRQHPEVEANRERRPVIRCGGHHPGWPWGMCTRGDDLGRGRWIEESVDALPNIESAERHFPSGSWEAIAVHDHWAARQARAEMLLNLGAPALAAAELDKIERRSPDPDPAVSALLARAESAARASPH